MAGVPEGKELFIVRVERGGPWDWSKDMREQAEWTEHAQFMNGLVDDGLILLGGPVEGGRDAFHVIDAPSEEALRARLRGGSVGAERDADGDERRAVDDPPRSGGLGLPR